MKKNTRSLLITSLILFCAGLLLAICTSLYAKISKIEVLDVEKKARTIENVTITIDDILKNSPESNYVKQLSESKFNRIDLSSFVGDVVITTSNDVDELVLKEANTNNIEYSIVGDTLTVKEVDAVGFMGFYVDKGGVSFKGLRHMFSPGNAINAKKIIEIKVPASLLLAQVDVYSRFGDVLIDGISSERINVESGNGTVEIKNLSNGEGKISVIGNFTDVELKNNLYLNCAVSTHFGDIKTHLIENSNTSTILDLWCGDIDVTTDLPTSLYKLSLSTSIGSISRNEKEVGKKLNCDGTGSARISSGIFLGDFHLNFSGDYKEDTIKTTEVPDTTQAPETTTEQPVT